MTTRGQTKAILAAAAASAIDDVNVGLVADTPSAEVESIVAEGDNITNNVPAPSTEEAPTIDTFTTTTETTASTATVGIPVPTDTDRILDMLLRLADDTTRRIDILSADMNTRLDTLADTLLADVLAAAEVHAIKVVDTHLATITEAIIDKKLDGPIKSGLDHRISRHVIDSVANDRGLLLQLTRLIYPPWPDSTPWSLNNLT